MGFLGMQLVLALLVESIGCWMAVSKLNNAPLYDLYIVMECLLLLLMIRAFGALNLPMLAGLFALVCCSALVEYQYWNDPSRFLMITSSLSSLFIVGASLTVLWHESESGTQSPFANSVFFISFAHLLYFAASATLVAPIILLMEDDPELGSILYYFSQLVCVARYVSIGISCHLPNDVNGNAKHHSM